MIVGLIYSGMRGEVMRLTVKIQPLNELCLPLNYQQVLQGYIYRTLTDCEFAQFLHEKGYISNGRKFKLFTFSRLLGKFRIDSRHKKIIFEEGMTWHVSSVLPEFIQDFGQSLLTAPAHQLNGQTIHIEEVTYTKPHIESNKCTISMLSPLTIHSTYETSEEKKITQFFSPQDAVFPHLVQENMKKKYAAYYGEQANDLKFHIRPLKVSSRDKVVTKVKDFIVTAWGGLYELQGSPELLQFTLSVGLGARNSQGFGMVELIDK